MVSGDNVTVTLTGGSPWGFRLTGGGSLPLQIAKIRKKSQAHAQGLQEGDAVVSINGTPVHDRSHDQAVDLLDSAGDTLTLTIFRGDADDLGQLLANNRPPGPVLPPQTEGGGGGGGGEVVVHSASSTSVTEEGGGRRREVQHNFFVTTDGDTESATFVQREHTVTATTSDFNGNDASATTATTGGGGLGQVVVGDADFGNLTANIEVSTSFESSSAAAVVPTVSLSPKPGPSVSPKPVSSSVPFTVSATAAVASPSRSPQPIVMTFSSSSQQESVPRGLLPASEAPRPTFKAAPPRAAPSVAPKPVNKPQGPARPTFNAKAVVGGGGGGPQTFQASASAMYVQQPEDLQPGVSQVKFQPQFSGRKPTPQSSQLSPMNLSSPLSPVSQPFSPLSPSSGPVFNVRNNVNEGPMKVWRPNMWLPGQEPQQKQHHQHPPQQEEQHHHHPQHHRQQQQQQQYYQPPPGESNNENIEVPRRMTVKERRQMLLNEASRNRHSLSARQADPEFDAPPEEVQRQQQQQHHHRIRVFAPPVEMTAQGPCDVDLLDSPTGSSPTSSLNRKKKLYADSTFYADPAQKYPTIDEQMRLCRLISHSLTSAANRRARGAKMFAKRKRKSSKWVHEGHSEWSSSGAGDVANIDDLDSELDPEDGGSRQLFFFRIPNLKNRVASPERNTRMSLKKDEFERLRLQAQKCEHRTVSPGTCFDIAADLKAHKGRGGRLFERRKNRADKFIIDNSNAIKMAGPKHSKLDGLLDNAPHKSKKSPWEAAQEGNVGTAFQHLDDRERLQKMNQIIKTHPSKPAPAPQPTREVLQPLNTSSAAFHGPKTNLRTSSTLPLLKGRDFNRYARGWGASNADYPDRAESTVSNHSSLLYAAAQDYYPAEAATLPRGAGGGAQNRSVHFGDYNPRPKAWHHAAPPPPPPPPPPHHHAAEPSSYSCPASMSASWASSDFDSMYQPHYSPAGAATHAVYAPDELPASDM